MTFDRHPATRMQLKKLLASKDFQEIQKRAKADETNVQQYTIEARIKFGLSPYWHELLNFILLYGFSPDNLAGGAVIATAHDHDIDKDFYHIIVYPETSKRDVEHAYAVINERYVERGDKKRSRTSLRFDIEVKAARLSEEGFDSKAIAAQLDSDERTITPSEVPDMIAKGLKKIAKAKTEI